MAAGGWSCWAATSKVKQTNFLCSAVGTWRKVRDRDHRQAGMCDPPACRATLPLDWHQCVFMYLFFIHFYLWTGSSSCSESAESRSSTAAESLQPAPRTRSEAVRARSSQKGTAALPSSPSSLGVCRLFNPVHIHWTAGARTIPLFAGSRREKRG